MRLGSILVAVLSLTLGACAGKPLQIKCAGFADQLVDLPDFATESGVHDDNDWVGDEAQLHKLSDKVLGAYLKLQMQQTDSWLGRQISAMQGLEIQRTGTREDGQAKSVDNWFERPILMLSGGGQWGAYGAAFLQQAHAKPEGGLPDFRIVTGVSTGAMQALYFGNWRNAESRAKALELLNKAYEIKAEREIVNRGGFAALVTKGSMAQLGPLYKRILDRICPDDAKSCPAVEAFRTTSSNGPRNSDMVLVGLVDAASGKFKFVSLNALVDSQYRSATGSADKTPAPQRAARCLAGAVLASSAMPGYYQQLQVGDDADPNKPNSGYKTYIDGGARASVFMATISKMFTPSVLKAALEAQGALIPDVDAATMLRLDNASDIYVVRNGPTVVRELDDKLRDKPWSGIDAMQRGYDIMVNQSEVNSIAAIRLMRPTANLRLTTADGFAAFKNGSTRCLKKDQRAMFDPDFMKCLARLGQEKAAQPAEKMWITVDQLRPEAG